MNEAAVMRKVGMTVSVLMGITMSFFLSLIGVGTSGKFTVPGWLISFLISTVVSLIIGFIIPMGKVTRGASAALKLKPGSIPTRLLESFISDLIYTPIITFLMVFYAYRTAIAHGAPAEALNLGRMFLGSFLLCFVAGFILIFFLMPVYVKLAIKKNQPKE